MGGQAFAEKGRSSNPPFTVPRMEKHIYEHVKKTAFIALSKRFENVAVLPEAPEKSDYGDVDLVVETSSSLPSLLVKDLAQDLEAKHSNKNHPNYHFAVSRPDSIDDTFAQVDVTICSPGYLEWTLFFQGYGDMGQIVGAMIHGYGFTVTNTGFHVRIKEQETRNWNDSRVFLSSDSEKVMDFLRLNKHQFAKGFDSEQQMFSWLSTCRLLNRKRIESREDDSDMRRRIETRPMFRRFITDYLPNLPDTTSNSTETRGSILQEALYFFGKTEEFSVRRRKVLSDIAEDHAWNIIKTTVLGPLAHLEGKRLNEVVRAFKRFVAFNRNGPYICDEPEMSDDCQARFSVALNDNNEVEPAMREWILAHWEEVRSLERQRDRERKTMAMQYRA